MGQGLSSPRSDSALLFCACQIDHQALVRDLKVPLNSFLHRGSVIEWTG